MSTPLQQFQHDRSSYERPNQDWVCGRASCGKPCALGPDHKGGCHTVAECVPSRQGDRWKCTRPGAVGGACTTGPLPDGRCCKPIVPCTPTRSLRFVRGSIVRWTALASLGAVLLTLGLERGEEVFEPGPLTTSHAHLQTADIRMNGASQCSACHGESSSVMAEVIGAEPGSGIGPVQSSKCLECHPMGARPMNPHALSHDELERLTALAKTPTGGPRLDVALARAAGLGVRHDLHDGAIECVACHSEHHGADADLRRVSDQQCQTCHAEPFDTFAHGHPEFGSYPYDRDERISFSHASHIRTHFNAPEHAGKAIACMTCHQTDSAGNAMLVRGYEQACLDCHDGQINGEARSALQGVRFFTIPALDVRSLEESGRPIGAWPADSAIYAGGVTPFMRLLLAGDERVALALSRTDERTLQDLYEADDQTLDDAHAIAWGVKRLVRDMIARGQPEVVERVERAVGRPLGRTEARLLLGGMPVDALRQAESDWFDGRLHLEVERHAAGLPPTDTAPTPEPTAVAEDDTEEPADDDLFGDDLLGGDDDLLGGSDDLLAGGDDVLSGDDDLLGGSDDLLGGDDDLLGGSDDLLTGDDALLGGSDDLLGGSDDLLGGDDDLVPSDDATADADAFELAPFETIDPQAWVGYGGWFIVDGETRSLAYRPTGHADNFLVAWLESTSVHVRTLAFPSAEANELAHGAMVQVFETLSDPSAPGSCMKCHTVSEPMPGEMRVHWHAQGPDPDYTVFTRFAHAPHITDMGDNACFACHEVTHIPAGEDPRNCGPSCFEPMTVADCQTCHNPREVSDSCLTCHNYHVGVRTLRDWGGSLDAMPDSEPPEASDTETGPQAARVPFWRRTRVVATEAR